jgi:hypothetical protein
MFQSRITLSGLVAVPVLNPTSESDRNSFLGRRNSRHNPLVENVPVAGFRHVRKHLFFSCISYSVSILGWDLSTSQPYSGFVGLSSESISGRMEELWNK